MTKKEWQEYYGFDDTTMQRIEISLSLRREITDEPNPFFSNPQKSKLTKIWNQPLDYQDIKISMKCT